MKKITSIILATLTLVSCEDYLDKSPVTSSTEESFYKTEEDMYQALVAAYEPLQRNWGTSSVNFVCDIASDDAYGGGGSATDGPDAKRLNRGKAIASDGMWEDIWKNHYAGIYRANLFLEKVGDSEISDDNKKAYSGEASFLRAYYYSVLVRMFENIPLITKTLAPSEYSQKQAPIDSVYRQISTDLEAAIEKLDGISYGNSEKGRITEWAARAMLARMYLFYDGVYGSGDASSKMPGNITADKVLSYLSEIIKYSGADVVSDFATLWGHADINGTWEENSIEGIFEIQHSSQGQGWQWWGASYDIGNKCVVFVGPRGTPDDSEYYTSWGFTPGTQQLYDAYEAGDVRRDLTLVNCNQEIGEGNYTIGDQHTGFFNKKYSGLKSHVPEVGQPELNFPQNYIAIRYADVLLMAAELELKIGDKGHADLYYNKVRRRALGDSYSDVNAVTLEQIMEERKLEFAYEGIRYWDLLRQGFDVLQAEINKTNLGGIYDSGVNALTRGFFPIPLNEIALSNYALEQNEGYK